MLMTCSMVTLAANNTYDESHTNIVVTAEQPEFVVTLTSNPTTGYSWFLQAYNANLIIPIKRSFKAPDKKLLGAAGVESWTFRVMPTAFTVPHQTSIHMIYKRPWEKSSDEKPLVFQVNTSG